MKYIKVNWIHLLKFNQVETKYDCWTESIWTDTYCWSESSRTEYDCWSEMKLKCIRLLKYIKWKWILMLQWIMLNGMCCWKESIWREHRDEVNLVELKNIIEYGQALMNTNVEVNRGWVKWTWLLSWARLAPSSITLVQKKKKTERTTTKLPSVRTERRS